MADERYHGSNFSVSDRVVVLLYLRSRIAGVENAIRTLSQMAELSTDEWIHRNLAYYKAVRSYLQLQITQTQKGMPLGEQEEPVI